jgi:hypothetical protein
MGSEGSYVHKGIVTPLFLYLCYSTGEVNPMSVLSWDPFFTWFWRSPTVRMVLASPLVAACGFFCF